MNATKGAASRRSSTAAAAASRPGTAAASTAARAVPILPAHLLAALPLTHFSVAAPMALAAIGHNFNFSNSNSNSKHNSISSSGAVITALRQQQSVQQRPQSAFDSISYQNQQRHVAELLQYVQTTRRLHLSQATVERALLPPQNDSRNSNSNSNTAETISLMHFQQQQRPVSAPMLLASNPFCVDKKLKKAAPQQQRSAKSA